MISVNGLKKVFGKHVAVDGVSFSLAVGDIVGVIGPNGAGKSTTMKMLTGFLPATSGTIEISGKNIVKHRRDIQERVGYLPEAAPAYGDMTVYQFLVFIARVRGITKKDRPTAIGELVEKINLQQVLNKKIKTLSKGFVRLIGLAQAIIHDPDILILDEPTYGLDPNQKHQVRKIIKALSKDKVIVISTHLLEDVDALCNRALVITDGKLKFDGTPTSLKQGSKSYNSVTLKLSYAADISGLEDIEGVGSIEIDQNTNQVTLFPEKDKAIVHLIGEYVFQRRLPVDEMTISQGKLDEVFRSLTSAEAQPEVSELKEVTE